MIGLIGLWLGVLLGAAFEVQAQTPFYQASPSATEDISPIPTALVTIQPSLIPVASAPGAVVDTSQAGMEWGEWMAIGAILGSGLGLWWLARNKRNKDWIKK